MQFASKDLSPRKHQCLDCSMCQGCSESRCRACRGEKARDGCRKLSIQEQIGLYNSLNPHLLSTAERHCSVDPGDQKAPVGETQEEESSAGPSQALSSLLPESS